MDLRELHREIREQWREIEKLVAAIEELNERDRDRRDQTRQLRTLLNILGDESEGLIARLHKLPATVTEQLGDRLNSDALDLVRHIRYWRQQLNGREPTGPMALPPPPPPGTSGAFAAYPPEQDTTKPVALHHTDGRQRIMAAVGEAVWLGVKRGWPFLLAAASAAITHFAHGVHP